ncbi:MAG: beta-lactamase family protein [Prolixibacteraceae bacterium]|nr:beta-lactamase family protein [Prolixibacteraceae bacterium]
MTKIKIQIIAFIGLLFIPVLINAGYSSKKTWNEAKTKTEQLFQNELDKNNVHNAFLQVYSLSHQIDWSFVGGHFQNGDAVTTANPFYTASIGKTFTATAIALLKEKGKLNFRDKISNYLPDSLIKNLHVFKGKNYSEEITVSQLLQHTSGLPDYFEDETNDGSPNVMELIFTDTAKFWKPAETIAFAKEKMQPLFAPGTDYHYTDTEYVLLGLILENISKMSLSDFFQKHFFEPFEMQHTYMNLRSEPISETGKISELYAGDFEAGTMTSLSADWAGGGLVSTTCDLIKFQHALFSGKIVSEQTLETMQNWVPETHGMEYGFGLRKIEFKKLFPVLPDLTIVGHSGSTGSFMYYCPELDVYLAGTLNQTDEVKNSLELMGKILDVIDKM